MDLDWHVLFEGKKVEEMWTLLKNEVSRTIERNVPITQVVKSRRQKWVTKEIVSMLRKKKNSWKTYKRDMTHQSRVEYEKAAKAAKYAIRRSKAKVEKELAMSKDDNGRKFRSYVKAKTKCRPGVGPLLNQVGEPVTDPKDMATILNNYFGSVFTRENIDNVPQKEMETDVRLNKIDIWEKDILEKISDLKTDSAPGPDGICPLFLKETDKIIAKSLKIIFESTLKEKKCPSEWKEANVVAIYKKGPKGNPENYRPVSLTSIVCKIFESIVKDALSSHLERNKLISDSQHGFMKGRSCTTNLVEFFDKVTEAVDRGEAVDIFYLDFAKAFDKVPRERLLEKLRAKGVDGEVLAWLRDWLTDRKQRVVCEGNFSESIQVESGVPQGTVLGPPLFSVFIDDIDEVAKRIELSLKFADDTKGMKIIRGEEDRKILQETLDGLVEWAEKWGIKFNLAKCKIMHVGRNNPGYVYTMGGVALEEVEEEQDVGVTVHKSLKNQLYSAKGQLILQVRC